MISHERYILQESFLCVALLGMLVEKAISLADEETLYCR